MNLARPANRLLARLGQAEVAHFPLANEVAHGPHHVLDGNVLVHAVLVEEVDVVGLEAAQRPLDGLTDVLGPAVHADDLSVLDLEPELGRDDRLVALSLERLSEQLLVVERAVDLGRVEEVHAELERPVDGGD
jgi:hypothetical protein